MKQFFIKVWAWIKALWGRVKDLLKALCGRVKEWLAGLPAVYYLCFILGMFGTAFFAMILPKVAEWPIVPVIALAILVAFIRVFCGRKVDVWRYVAVVLGGIPIWIMAIA